MPATLTSRQICRLLANNRASGNCTRSKRRGRKQIHPGTNNGFRFAQREVNDEAAVEKV